VFHGITGQNLKQFFLAAGSILYKDYSGIRFSSVNTDRMVTMSKKKQKTGIRNGISLNQFQSVAGWMRENQNWIYIAIIGFCLTVTILYKLSQWYGS